MYILCIIYIYIHNVYIIYTDIYIIYYVCIMCILCIYAYIYMCVISFLEHDISKRMKLNTMWGHRSLWPQITGEGAFMWMICNPPSASCCCGAPCSSCTRPRWPSSRSRSPATSCSPCSPTACPPTWPRACCPPPACVSLPSSPPGSVINNQTRGASSADTVVHKSGVFHDILTVTFFLTLLVLLIILISCY